MKKIVLTAFIFLGFSAIASAQETGTKEKKTERITLIKGGGSLSSKKTLTPTEEMNQCKSQLIALDQKESWIRSNDGELEKAIESSWFENAAKTREQLNTRIAELEKELKK